MQLGIVMGCYINLISSYLIYFATITLIWRTLGSLICRQFSFLNAVSFKRKYIDNPTFSRDQNSDFAKTLRKRVNLYFKTKNISRNANATMVTKTVIMLTLFIVPLILLGTGMVTTTGMLFAAYLVCGLGMSGIGMGIMHDAIHGSYSKSKKINTLLSNTFNMMGANVAVWRVQHNILHHTYTNIDEADDDLNSPYFLRFSPHAKHYKAHKFQHLYIWFFYGLSTISWITTKDFVRLNRYRDMGFFDGKNEYRNILMRMIGWKLLYYSYALVLPLIMVPLSWWVIVLAFLSMHFVTGLLVSIVFQIAHIMPVNEFPLPDSENKIKNDWYHHQFATTANFSPNSKVLFWLVGGLNYQVEHHLLPDVCHVHYKALTNIVAETAREYNMPYHVNKSFFSAIRRHITMLRALGKQEVVVTPL